MITWLLLNTCFTALVLAGLQIMRDAPHWLRLRITLAALFSWLLPWGMLQGSLSPVLGSVGADTLPLAALEGAIRLAPAREGVIRLPLWPALLLLSGVGAFLFAREIMRYRFLLGRLGQRSRNAHHLWDEAATLLPAEARDDLPPLRIQDAEQGAFTTGFRKPVVWLHRGMVNDPNLSAVLLHEYGHVRRHDNRWLWLVGLIENLLWWNPLVRLLGGKSRQFIELRCDEFCAGKQEDYRLRLQQLILSHSARKPVGGQTLWLTGIFQGDNFNVERVRLLNRRHTMKIRHVIATVLLGASVAFTANLGLAQRQDTPEEVLPDGTPEQRERYQERYQELQEWRRNGRDIERIVLGLEVYASRLEQAYNELQEEHAELQRMQNDAPSDGGD